MNIFLTTLKERLEEAQARSKDIGQRFHIAKSAAELATQRFQAVTAEWTAVSQELAGWTKTYEIESKRESAKEEEAKVSEVGKLDNPAGDITQKIETQVSYAQDPSTKEELNKTELIRDTLKATPTGMTPGELYQVVKDQIPRRNYVYSILSRLKEREQVTVRRGKYIFRTAAKPVEVRAGEHAMPIE